MKRETGRRKAIATELTKADPLYVSMVQRGANQRPFHAVKSHGAGNTSTAHKEKEMADTTKVTKAAPDVLIARVIFDKAEFPTAESVTEHLTAKGYSEFEVKEEGDTFAVDDAALDLIEGDTREVESTTVKGLRYIVGTAKKSAEETTAGADVPAEGNAPKGETETVTEPEAAPAVEEVPEPKGDDVPADDAGDAVEGDKPEEQPEAQPEADPAPAAKAEVRKRTRKHGLTVATLSPVALAASYEALGDFIETKGLTSKSFADNILEYQGPIAPGIYALTDAFTSELRRLIKLGRADETAVTSLTAEFGKAIVVIQGAYDSILTASLASKAEEAELDAIVDHLFGSPKEVTAKAEEPADPHADAIAVLMAETASLKTLVQRSLDLAAISTTFESAFIESEETAPARVIPARKSESAVDDNPNALDAERDQGETEETNRRVAKRLGLML